jgi:nitroreductase
MDVFEAIDRRHSYRGHFTNKKILRSDLIKIVQAGIQAPSGCNAQTTSFIIVDDDGLLKQMSEIVDKKPVMDEARAVIVCVVENKPVYKGQSFAVEDCAAAVENMLLAITGLGLATVWLDGVLRADSRAERIAALLGVPENRQVRIVLPLGYPKEVVSQASRLPFEERASFNRFALA